MSAHFSKLVGVGQTSCLAVGILVASDKSDGVSSIIADNDDEQFVEHFQDLGFSDEYNGSSTIEMDNNVVQNHDDIQHLYFQDVSIEETGEDSISDVSDDVSEVSSCPPICKDLPSGHNVIVAEQQARINNIKKNRRYHPDFSDTASVATDASTLITRASDKAADIKSMNKQVLGDGHSMLFNACRSGDVVIVKRVLEDHVRIDVNKQLEGTVEALGERHGIRFEHPVATSVQARSLHGTGYTPLHLVYANQYLSVAQELLRHPNIDVNAVDSMDCTPLMFAVHLRWSGGVQLLLDHPKIDVNKGHATIPEGRTPLAVLAFKDAPDRRDLDILQKLIEHPGLNVNCSSMMGITPLMLAAKRDHKSVVACLLSHPEIDTTLKTNGGKTAYTYSKKHPDILQMLQSHQDPGPR